MPVFGSDVPGLTEVSDDVPEDKIMESLAKANGIDPETFDYDKWLEEQKEEIANEDKA